MIYVVNKRMHKETSRDFYIGRPNPLGNPYSHKLGTMAEFKVNTRDEAIDQYETHLENCISICDTDTCTELNKIWTMAKEGDVYLVCWCKPLRCHGDIIKKIVEERLNRS